MNTNHRLSAEPGIESRLALRMAGALTASSEQVPHDLSERLRFGRERALERARALRRAAPALSASKGGATAVGMSASGAAMMGSFAPWWQRAVSVLPLVLLIVGLLAIDKWSVREQVLAAADIDAQLLADDLPPAAFSDPGFAEFLRSAP